MAFATARVGIHQFNEAAHATHAVADDHRRLAPRRGDELVTDDQDAVILAREKTLDEHGVADLEGRGVRSFDLLARCQVDGDALALIAVLRLDDDGVAILDADFARGGPGVRGVRHRAAGRNRDAGGLEQCLRQLLVLCDRFGERAGAVRLGSLDAALFAAPAELHHAAFRQAAIGDVARHRGIDDRTGARPESDFLVEFAQAAQSIVEFEGKIVNSCAAEVLRQVEGEAADLLLTVFDDDLINALFDGFRRAAEGDRATRLRLETQRGEFEGVRHRDDVEADGRLQQRNLRKALTQARFKFRDVADGAFDLVARDDGFDRGMPTPQIGAA